MLLRRIIIGLIISGAGFVLIKSARTMVLWFGENETINRLLGYGGMYSFWRLAGSLMFFIGILYMFGVVDKILDSIAGVFGI